MGIVVRGWWEGTLELFVGRLKGWGKILASKWDPPSPSSPLGETLVTVFVLFILNNVSFTFT